MKIVYVLFKEADEMKYKISVIIPVYNVAMYLSKCIDSVINQTYKNLEIVLVEDGSSDDSGEICDYYALQDSRIKVIHKDNGGLSDARNIGLDLATGDYISFIDSDDYIHQTFYDVLVNLITINNADIAQCDFLKIYEDNNCHNIWGSKQNNENSCEITILNNIAALNNLYHQNCVSNVVVWNKIYKRNLFSDIRFPKGKIHEDEFTTYKLLYKSTKVVITSNRLYYYLQRPNSIMGREFNTKRLDVLEAYSAQISFYETNNLFELKIYAIEKLEGLLREFMIEVLKSNIEDKEQTFLYLVYYYRNAYHLFINYMDVSIIKKFLMELFHFSPIYVVRVLCKLLDFRKSLLKGSKTT
ncbi:glycosyltransferase family 2 protein [Bacillus massiliigorillae]|uniref:glycosyltransferase family 2 protein n=1 Tax=Bacillus massiliigorillae TaxID=1243664 RepID=UPI0006949AB2|nr:glycosyltransferase [Bacillus massiliigorillae]